MNAKSERGRIGRFIVGLMSVALTAHAQTTSSTTDTTTPDTTTPEAGDVIQLSEFSVMADQATGYRPTNSITATGIGARIADTPIAISVVTRELLSDRASFELHEALNMVPGVITNPRSESSFNIRGFGGNISYRNGQYRRQLLTTWNTDRVEVIKGPSSIFFGAVRPSGIVNYVTTKPVLESRFTDVKVTLGTEDYYRAEAYFNVPLNDKLAVRIGTGFIDSGGDRQFQFRDEYYGSISVLWQPTANQQIVFDVEGVERNEFYINAYGGRAVSNSLYLFNPAVPAANQATTTAATATRSWLDANGHSSIPTFDIWAPIYGVENPEGYGVPLARDARSRNSSRTVDLQYLLKISDNLVWQTDLNWSLDDGGGIQPSTGETNAYADGTLRFRVEEWRNIRDTYNIDNKLTWRFELGGTKHTIQLGQELQNVVFERPGYVDSSNRWNDSPYSGYTYNFRPGVTAPVSLRAMMDAGGQYFNAERDRTEKNYGYFIVDQVRMFDDRLFVLGGARYNKFTGGIEYTRAILNSSQSAANGGLADFDVIAAKGGWTPQLGVLAKIGRSVSLYGNLSESIEPVFALDADGGSSEAVESEGYELGVKTELYGGRVTTTLAYYSIDRANIAYRDTLRETQTGRAPYYIFGNAEAGDGLELDINLSPIDNYQIVFGWTHIMEAHTTASNGSSIDGPRFGYLPDNMFTLWNRYTFTTGSLKGLSVGLGIRHNDEARVANSGSNFVINPSFTVCDFMASMPVHMGDRDVKLQLNIKNLTDELYRLSADGYLNDKRRIFLSAQTRF